MDIKSPPAPKAPKPLESGIISISLKDVWWVLINNTLHKYKISYISPDNKIIGFEVNAPTKLNLYQGTSQYFLAREIEFMDLVEFDQLPGFREALIHRKGLHTYT